MRTVKCLSGTNAYFQIDDLRVYQKSFRRRKAVIPLKNNKSSLDQEKKEVFE